MAKKAEPDNKQRVLLVEPRKASRESLRKTISKLGYAVEPNDASGGVLEAADAQQPQIVVAASDVVDQDLCHYLQRVAEYNPAVMVLYPRGTPNPGDKARKLGADVGLSRPVAATALTASLDLLGGLNACRRSARRLERRVEELGDRLERIGDRQSGHRFYHYDFFKHLLVIEIRRARRYRYPVSVCMLEVDPVRLPPGSLMVRGEIRTGVARAVSESIRDIDIPVYIGGETILLFLPHTAVPGAQKVAKRVSRLIAGNPYRLEGDAIKITASIGVCGIETGQRLTFSQLIQKAQRALLQAKQAGGARIVTAN